VSLFLIPATILVAFLPSESQRAAIDKENQDAKENTLTP
jgi:hypothetical protein